MTREEEQYERNVGYVVSPEPRQGFQKPSGEPDTGDKLPAEASIRLRENADVAGVGSGHPEDSSASPGHRDFSYGDHLYANFLCDKGPTTRYVRVERPPGGGTAFVSVDGTSIPADWPLVDWRYATAFEIDEFRISEDEIAEEEAELCRELPPGGAGLTGKLV